MFKFTHCERSVSLLMLHYLLTWLHLYMFRLLPLQYTHSHTHINKHAKAHGILTSGSVYSMYIYVNMSVFLDLFLGNYFNTIQKCFRTAYIHIYNNLPWSRVFTQPVRHSNTVMFTFNIYKYLYNSTFLFHNLHTRYMDACCVCSTFSFNFRSK